MYKINKFYNVRNFNQKQYLLFQQILTSFHSYQTKESIHIEPTNYHQFFRSRSKSATGMSFCKSIKSTTYDDWILSLNSTLPPPIPTKILKSWTRLRKKLTPISIDRLAQCQKLDKMMMFTLMSTRAGCERWPFPFKIYGGYRPTQQHGDAPEVWNTGRTMRLLSKMFQTLLHMSHPLVVHIVIGGKFSLLILPRMSDTLLLLQKVILEEVLKKRSGHFPKIDQCLEPIRLRLLKR